MSGNIRFRLLGLVFTLSTLVAGSAYAVKAYTIDKDLREGIRDLPGDSLQVVDIETGREMTLLLDSEGNPAQLNFGDEVQLVSDKPIIIAPLGKDPGSGQTLEVIIKIGPNGAIQQTFRNIRPGK